MRDRFFNISLAIGWLLQLSGCAVHTRSDASPGSGVALDEIEQLGGLLFEDTQLSAAGTQSCASCHDAQRAFTGNADAEDPLNPVATGAFPTLRGSRNVPTAMYQRFNPDFAFVLDGGRLTATGGHFWDGRAMTLIEQAEAPFLNPREMAMPDKQAVIDKVRAASYAGQFMHLFGPTSLDDTDRAYVHVAEAIESFELSARFEPFSAKFDAVLRGEAQFSEHEARGFVLFKNPRKGNCISCHVGDEGSTDPKDWPFTDFTYDDVGVPRNPEIPDNDDPTFFDLGLCKQPDLEAKLPVSVPDPAAFQDRLCGAFKVPTLRNIAKTAPYMHNGFFKKLRDVVEFYATRDTDPGKWYPKDEQGKVQKFDDLPAMYKINVNTTEVPYDRSEGEVARLDAGEIDDLVAFLNTLSDGYSPSPSSEIP